MRSRSLLIALLVCLVVIGRAGGAFAFGDCHNGSYMYAFDRSFTPTDCDIVSHFVLHGAGNTVYVRLIKKRSSAMGDTAPIITRVQNLIDHFGAAMDAVRSVTIGETTILLTDSVPPHEEIAHAWHFGDECVIPFYKQQEGMSENEFIFSMAHEMFHCIQHHTWPGQMAIYPDGAWWVEGSAEYFAQLAMPGTSESDDYVHDFDTEATSTAILDMVYENVVFFSWLTQRHGPSALPAFAAAMARNPTRSSQLGALQLVLSKDEWMQFVEDYLDQRIQFPSGRSIPSHPQEGQTIRISDQRDVASPSNPYQVEHNVLQFERGHFYSVTPEGQPADMIMRWSEDGGAWVETPSGVPACNEPHRYRVAWGTTNSTGGGHLTIKPRGAGDTCPFLGTWVLTGASLAHDIQVMFGSHNTCNLTSGQFRMTLNADGGGGHPGTGSFSHDNISFRCVSEGGSSEITMNGTESILWAPVQSASTNNLFIGIQGQGRPIGTIHKVSHSNVAHYPNERGEDGVAHPFVTDDPLLAGVGVGPFLGGRYRFGPGLLHIDPPPGYPDDPNYSFDFTRVGAPPPHP